MDHGYAAVLEGSIDGADVRATRAEAERDADWLRGHPARKDRELHGHGGDVLVVEVTRCEWTGELIDADRWER